jgi:hypothetical protein
MCKWLVTYIWKTFDKGYNFDLNLTLIKGFHKKLWAFKVMGIPILRILGSQVGSPRIEWHLGAGPVAKRREYYKVEGGGFPQVQAMVSILSPCLHVTRPCTKNAPTTHWPTCCFVCAGPCKSVQVIDLLVVLPSPHLEALARPSTPKVFQAKECAPIPYPSIVFTLWTCSWIHQGVWGCVNALAFVLAFC